LKLPEFPPEAIVVQLPPPEVLLEELLLDEELELEELELVEELLLDEELELLLEEELEEELEELLVEPPPPNCTSIQPWKRSKVKWFLPHSP
jgi:hypothetical protein